MRKKGRNWKQIEKFIEFNRQMEEEFVTGFALSVPVMIYKYFRKNPPSPKDDIMRFLYEESRAQAIKRRFRFQEGEPADRERTIQSMDLLYDMEIENEPSKVESYIHCVQWCAELLRAYEKRRG